MLSGSIPQERVIIAVDGRPYELGGSLSSTLVPGEWRVAGFAQGYVVFTYAKPPSPISARTSAGAPLSVQVISSTTKSEQVRVDAPVASTVIRSVAWDSGWKGTVSVDGGTARSIPVTAYDLVQQVRIPAGDDVVTFHYRPPHLLAASVLSLGAVGLLVALLAGWLVVRRRRRRPSGRDGDADAGEGSEEADDEPAQPREVSLA